MVDRGGCRAERGADGGEVFGVAGQDVVPQPQGQDDEVGVDDIRRARERQEPAGRYAVVIETLIYQNRNI